MSYIEKLCSFTNLGKKGGKDFLLNYYSKLGNPQNNLKVIHITGTAGKGSTASMIAKGLKLAGYKVGLLTSPHLLRLNERIRINDEEISNDDLNKYIKYFFEKIPDASFTEYLVLIATKYFLDNNVDYFVCEAFVGGKFDKTNIFNSIVTVITSIGLDHQNLLGYTEKEILKEKLGILRKNIPLFARLDYEIIREEVERVGAKYFNVNRLEDTSLIGDFQKENAGIAYEVLKYLNIDKDLIRSSLKNVIWKGRVQFVEDNVLVDCAHNILGMKRLMEYVETLDFDNIYYLFAISKNKSFKDFQKHFITPKEVIYTRPKMFNIENPIHYANEDQIFDDSVEGYEYLRNKMNKDDLLVVCGSIFLVSEILGYKELKETNKKKFLLINP